jgi:hypothetical protein
MKLIKWLFFFAIAFLISMVVITTFSQPAFMAAVPVRILFYYSREIPIYFYIAGAFFAGLAIGLLVAVWNYFSLSGKIRQKNKTVRSLEDEISILRRQPDFTDKKAPDLADVETDKQ